MSPPNRWPDPAATIKAIQPVIVNPSIVKIKLFRQPRLAKALERAEPRREIAEPVTYTAGMHANLALSLSALLSLLPVAILVARGNGERNRLFWLLLWVAVAGPLVVAIDLLWQGWLTGLSAALWTSIAASLVVFLVVCIVTKHGWRLTPLLFPYLLLFGIGATLADRLPERRLASMASPAWLDAHIVLSIATYALLTLAAVAALAVFIQEAALKRPWLGRLGARLPSIADTENLQMKLLTATAVVLGFGLLTGIINQYQVSGAPLAFNHKTLLALFGFATIAMLLAMHYRTGLRGRRAARYILIAYLLVTLAYPGVKFVTNVLLA
jgi:ABC-type uncharacterized transport system permease subunit